MRERGSVRCDGVRERGRGRCEGVRERERVRCEGVRERGHSDWRQLILSAINKCCNHYVSVL